MMVNMKKARENEIKRAEINLQIEIHDAKKNTTSDKA